MDDPTGPAGRHARSALYGAPLCPAGHLPHEGGDRLPRRLSPIGDVARMSEASKLPISPLVGEMSGRTEGGAVVR
ncbi:lytic murein transglycosylase [Mesorhizobium sp. SARCC-RB16n]|nr:lytic murein transglycosylase [Mesorhizobium sp. SARCC-RB16n]